MVRKTIRTDVLIIGGGTAGCYAAITLGRRSDLRVVIAEKANIERSGCLAAGVNALNAYITEGHDAQFYVDYAKRDADGIVREDLLRTMSERLNQVTEDLEKMGLVILKDAEGHYVNRGPRNIKINGENIKVLLAKETRRARNVTVLNHVNITDLKSKTGPGGAARVVGAVGFGVNEDIAYDITARAVLCACGGAAGLYRPNNPGFSRHKMWYPPFNTGAGYAMGIRAGAEMTTFEMRFIALRCKDTIAPTGTIAQGVGARQVNASGEVYESRYGITTSERVWGTTEEKIAGRGPCYLRTKGIPAEQEQDLFKAYLNMAPAQTLRWIESGNGPSKQNVEIEGSEPYVVGGHTASGYWVDAQRRTTLPGLYAAGDVAGGCPQKYATGALAEGEIVAEAILEDLSASADVSEEELRTDTGADVPDILHEYEHFLTNPTGWFAADELEEAMQKVMDQYAGGISTGYRYNAAGLSEADRRIRRIEEQTTFLSARDTDDLLRIYELKERLTVCRVLIAHLAARKETRWHSFGENADYPEKSEEGLCYVNSRMKNGEVEILYRELDYKIK